MSSDKNKTNNELSIADTPQEQNLLSTIVHNSVQTAFKTGLIDKKPPEISNDGSERLSFAQSLSFFPIFESLWSFNPEEAIKGRVGFGVTIGTLGISMVNEGLNKRKTNKLNQQLIETKDQIPLTTDNNELEQLRKKESEIQADIDLIDLENALVDFTLAIPNIISSIATNGPVGFLTSAVQMGDALLRIARNPQADRYSKIYNAAANGGYQKDGPELELFAAIRSRKEMEAQIFEGMKQKVLAEADESAKNQTSYDFSRNAYKQEYMRQNFNEDEARANAKAMVKAMELAKLASTIPIEKAVDNVSQPPPTAPYNQTFGETLSTLGVILSQLGTGDIMQNAQQVYADATAINGELAQAEAQGITVGSNTVNNATSVHVAEVTINSAAQDLTGTGEDFGRGIDNILTADNAVQGAMA